MTKHRGSLLARYEGDELVLFLLPEVPQLILGLPKKASLNVSAFRSIEEIGFDARAPLVRQGHSRFQLQPSLRLPSKGYAVQQ